MSDPITVDTNALLMAAGAPDRLSRRGRELILNGEVMLFASSISIYEVGTKHRIGKLKTSAGEFRHACRGFHVLFQAPSETVMIIASELGWDHRDPWDRLIAAAALHYTEGRILTSDRDFDHAPGITRLWDGG